MKKILGGIVLTAVFLACSSDNDGQDPVTDPEPEVTFERGAMLTNWADNIIIPSYEAFNASLDELTAAVEEFKLESSIVNLEGLRADWVTSYTLWQRVSMFEIGPAETVGLRLNMNIYPTDIQKIEGFIASGDYNLTLSSNRDAKGFPALDYLINGLGADDTAIVSKFNTTDRDAILSYMEAVLEDMMVLSNEVLSEWNTGYRDTFVANDGASATASVDRYVNDYIFYYEKFLRAGKMGIPLGVFSGSPLPQNVEAFYQPTIANELFLEGLRAVQDFFNGKHYGSNTVGEGLASYLDKLNSVKDGENLSDIINGQFNEARSAVEGLGTFRTEIENNTPPTNMLLAYDAVQKAVPLLKVDMVSAMSISIDFVDADGD